VDTVNSLLDRCRAVRSLNSDAALAAVLGVGRAAVSGWRHGDRYPDTVSCGRIADVLGIPVGRVLGIVGEARENTRDAKQVWRRLAQASAFVVAALGIASAPGPARASIAGVIHSATSYTLCAIRRWLKKRRSGSAHPFFALQMGS
jgi:transcriptional regulator with XRE-family HTH domain